MGSYSLSGKRCRGFNPKGNTVRPIEKCGSRVLPTLLVLLTLALGMMVSAARPAYAADLVVSTKAISAPAGFRGVCERYAWACDRSSKASVHGAEAQLELAYRVNRAVNRQVREISDQQQYKQREYWALPTRRGGDCEDFALLKKRELQRAGIAPDRLLIATVLDRRQRAHAVLVLRTDRGDYVLDNLTSRIKPWNKTGYSFIRMQDPTTPSGWTVVMRGGIFRT
ncbi:transglutaminase-like cysteine peptidase [Ovoidimarina sediminis]|uniref:transglutaminase-like cysteine peptidase n=1 Tax=Ovoidimarina sediminis TaxID=3079856 RepID=UPI002909D80D|nr:transglutaminase-like cysteine peptidase [Rhodophyticola sp. MJ-SS7]MDU8942246.1 transglutaminase-like cysteine peptidase [Rhodophyticola sp. MJ-SS7]